MTDRNQSRMECLEATVLRMERAHRRQKLISSILTLGMVGLLAMGFARRREPGPLEGTSLTIVTEEGGKLAWIGDGERGGEIRLFDHEGNEYWHKNPPEAQAKMPPPPPMDVPPPLTDQQLSEMSLSETQRALSKVAKARNNPDLDEETKARLKRDFDLLIRRVGELKKKGG